MSTTEIFVASVHQDDRGNIRLPLGHEHYEPFEIALSKPDDTIAICVRATYKENTPMLDKPFFTMTVRTSDDSVLGKMEITSRDIRGQYDWFYKTLRFDVPSSILIPGKRTMLFVDIEGQLKVWPDGSGYPWIEKVTTEKPIEVHIDVPTSPIFQPLQLAETSTVQMKFIRGILIDLINIPLWALSHVSQESYDDYGEVEIIDSDVLIGWKHSFTTCCDTHIMSPATFTLNVYELAEDDETILRELFLFHTVQKFERVKEDVGIRYTKFFRDIQHWQWWRSCEEEQTLDLPPLPVEIPGPTYEFAIQPIGPYHKTFLWHAKITSDAEALIAEKLIKIQAVVQNYKIERAQYCYKTYQDYLYWKSWFELGSAIGSEVLDIALEIARKSNLYAILADMILELIDTGVYLWHYNECKTSMYEAKFGCDITFEKDYANTISLPKLPESIQGDSATPNYAKRITSLYQLIENLHNSILQLWQRYLSACSVNDSIVAEMHLRTSQKARTMLDAAIIEINDASAILSTIIEENLQFGDDIIDRVKERLQARGLSEKTKETLLQRGFSEERIEKVEQQLMTQGVDNIDFSYLSQKMTTSHSEISNAAKKAYFNALKILNQVFATSKMGEGDLLLVLLKYGLISYEEYRAKSERVGETHALKKLVGYPDEIEILAENDIVTTWQLLKNCSTPTARKHCAERTGIQKGTLLRLSNLADLMRVGGIDPLQASSLEKAGVDTVKELAQRNPSALYAMFSRMKDIPREQMPNLEDTNMWVSKAKKLKRALTY